MNNIINLLIILCLIFDFSYIYCFEKHKNILGLIVKTLASICFIVIAYINHINNSRIFSFLILLGLISDGLGDLFLGIRNFAFKKKSFIIGTLCFMIGHLIYIKALLELENKYLIYSIIIGLLSGLLIFYEFNKKCIFNGYMKLIGELYMIIIFIMLSISISTYLTSTKISNLFFMLGAILFTISDLILVTYNYLKKEKWMHPIYSIAYYIAQILISYSLFL